MYSESWYSCIDRICPKYGKKELTSRTNFWHHVAQKSTDRLHEIICAYNIVEFPHVLHPFTLTNLVTDYSKEPLASEIIRKFRVVT